MKAFLPVRRRFVSVSTFFLVLPWLFLECAECWTPPRPLSHKHGWDTKFGMVVDDDTTTSCTPPDQPQQCTYIGIGGHVTTKQQRQQQPQQMVTTPKSTICSDTMVTAATAIRGTAAATLLIIGSTILVPHAIAETGVVTTKDSTTSPPIAEAAVNKLSSSFSRDYTNLTPLGQSPLTMSTHFFMAKESSTVAPPAPIDVSPPTQQEISLLREAFATFYGGGGTSSSPNPKAALPLLDEVVRAWERQPADERAGLYRVRADCHMALLEAEAAIQDYSSAISLLQDGPGGEMADPAELPASLLGRARAVRSMGSSAPASLAHQAVLDYQQSLEKSSREEWDTAEELLLDGARTNPYATWEYGMALRLDGQLQKAMEIHQVASQYFDDIGDRARSVISLLDAGIDAAALAATFGPNNKKEAAKNTLIMAEEMLQNAIGKTTTVEGRDISLLQRVVSKEGEGRMALAALEWSVAGKRQDAETQINLACTRLDQLEADAFVQQQRQAAGKNPSTMTGSPKLIFSIDDLPGAFDTSCTRLKNKSFLKSRLEWPPALEELTSRMTNLIT